MLTQGKGRGKLVSASDGKPPAERSKGEHELSGARRGRVWRWEERYKHVTGRNRKAPCDREPRSGFL